MKRKALLVIEEENSRSHDSGKRGNTQDGSRESHRYKVIDCQRIANKQFDNYKDLQQYSVLRNADKDGRSAEGQTKERSKTWVGLSMKGARFTRQGIAAGIENASKARAQSRARGK
jgi:hypothetical protein